MNPDEIDQEEALEESVEQTNEAQEDYYEDNSPTQDKTDDLWSLFWKTVNIKDSSKLGNLDKQELGMLDISVRDAQNIALVAKTLGHDGFARWMNSRGQIILKTSASKKGWLTELFVTSKKYSSKEKKAGLPEFQAQEKKSFWGKNKR